MKRRAGCFGSWLSLQSESCEPLILGKVGIVAVFQNTYHQARVFKAGTYLGSNQHRPHGSAAGTHTTRRISSPPIRQSEAQRNLSFGFKHSDHVLGWKRS